MWAIWTMVAMVSVAGIYAMDARKPEPKIAAASSAGRAASMGIYLSAVKAYVRRHPEFTGTSVPDGELAGALPSWYVVNPSWHNYVDKPGGRAIVYADSAPAAGLAVNIAGLSKNLFAGDAALPASLAIPTGTPVWVVRIDD